jgi:hypothetical protein
MSVEVLVGRLTLAELERRGWRWGYTGYGAGGVWSVGVSLMARCVQEQKETGFNTGWMISCWVDDACCIIGRVGDLRDSTGEQP